MALTLSFPRSLSAISRCSACPLCFSLRIVMTFRYVVGRYLEIHQSTGDHSISLSQCSTILAVCTRPGPSPKFFALENAQLS